MNSKPTDKQSGDASSQTCGECVHFPVCFPVTVNYDYTVCKHSTNYFQRKIDMDKLRMVIDDLKCQVDYTDLQGLEYNKIIDHVKKLKQLLGV